MWIGHLAAKQDIMVRSPRSGRLEGWPQALLQNRAAPSGIALVSMTIL
jgi:hypothetical protein